MQPTIETLQTLDNFRLHTESWSPEGDARAVVIVVHGYGEHIGRYTELMQALVSAGYAAYGLDHRGHGRSDGMRVYFDNVSQPILDFERFVKRVHQQHPERKIFLFGHSMGTLISLMYVLHYAPPQHNPIRGIILSGTAITGTERAAPALISLARLADLFVPTLKAQAGVEGSRLSTIPEEVEAYNNDPLVTLGAWRVRTSLVLYDWATHLQQSIHRLTWPVLLLHGEDDEITPVSGAYLVNDYAATKDKTMHVYPGIRHEVLHDRVKDEALAAIIQWLNERS